MNLLDFIKNKSIIIISVIAIIISFILGFYGIKNNIILQKYTGKDFFTNYSQIQNNDEKEINSSEFKGIFTYGPYIALKKGDYTIKINYQSEIDNRFDIVADAATNVFAKDSLLASETEKEVNIYIEDDITDKSFEVRTYYDEGGYFKLNGISIKRNDFNAGSIITGLSFFIIIGLILFLLKDNVKNQYIMSIFGFLNYFLLYDSLIESYAILGMTFFVLLLEVVALKNNVFKKLSKIKPLSDIVSLVFTAFLIATILIVVKNPIDLNTLNFVKETSFSELMLYFVAITNILAVLRFSIFDRTFIGWLMIISSVIFGTLILMESERSVYLAFGIIIIIGYITYYLNKENILKIEEVKFSYNTGLVIVSLIAITFTIFFGLMTVYRYKTFSSSTFDFGIFAQMYEYMAKTGKPLSTCERDMLLSHFCIHISPIYYILLPFYMIFRSPESLLMMQAAVVFSGCIPVFLICKKFDMKPFITTLVTILYLVYPAFISPLYYDFHENKFLPVLIFWTIYFIENKKLIPFSIFMVLTLMVKEDAGLYLIFLALYYMILRKEFKFGTIMLLSSILYFIIAFSIIRYLGHSLIDGHYNLYYIGKQKGVLDMAKNIMLDTGFFINNIFTQDNFEFIIYVLGTLLFIPLLNKDIKNLILVIPLVGVNLMTDYTYQHNVGFQYVYGSCSLLLFLFILNIKDLDKKYKNTICLTSVIAGILLTYTAKGDNLYRYYKYYKENEARFMNMEELLDRIPQDVSITATTYLVPHLYDRDIVYTFDTKNETDYCVFWEKQDERYLKKVKDITDKGYVLVYDADNIHIYKTPEAPDMN